jgi:hypothetical protein
LLIVIRRSFVRLRERRFLFALLLTILSLPSFYRFPIVQEVRLLLYYLTALIIRRAKNHA